MFHVPQHVIPNAHHANVAILIDVRLALITNTVMIRIIVATTIALEIVLILHVMIKRANVHLAVQIIIGANNAAVPNIVTVILMVYALIVRMDMIT